MPIARWSLLSSSIKTARSSHCLSVTHTGLLVLYGGEHKPRIPVDDDHDGIAKGSVHVFDLKNSSQSANSSGWHVMRPNASLVTGAGSVPEARVGATTVFGDGHLYMWGGRGGVDMSPLPHHEAGIWHAKLPDEKSGTSGDVQ